MPVQIRLADARDAPEIAAIYAPFCESNVVSFEEVAPTAEVVAGRIAAIAAQFPWLVLDEGGTVAGYAYASRHHDRAAYRWSADVTVYIGPAQRRRGVGTALYTALLDLLRAQGYFKAYGGITLPNAGSVGLHEAMGFTLVGVYRGVGFKLGAWHDVSWYELSLQPERANPPDPLPIGPLHLTPAWHHAMSAGLARLAAR
jgi:phosphinothricin acetyltransferase